MDGRRLFAKVAEDRSSECRADAGDGCSYSTLRKTICSLENDESGKPIRKCEKMEEVLRKCVGRPQEVVSSKVDVIKEDASTSLRPFDLDFGISSGGRYAWDGRSGVPGGGRAEHSFRSLFERKDLGFGGAFEELVGAAEDAAQDVYGPFVLSEDQHQAEKGTPAHAQSPFAWFRGRSRNPSASESSANSRDPKDGVYERFASGIQEV